MSNPIHDRLSVSGKIFLPTSFGLKVTANGLTFDGFGKVLSSVLDTNTIVYSEEGLWINANGGRIPFTNSYKWTTRDAVLKLARYSYERADFLHLVDFEICANSEWMNISPHYCGDDVYRARLSWSVQALQLSWEIKGPHKNHLMEYSYS